MIFKQLKGISADLLNKVLNTANLELVKYPSKDIRRRVKLLKAFKINKVLDIGANIGRYSLALRKHGFKGKIISFEPLSNPFTILVKNANNDKYWQTENIALGDTDEDSEINIAGNIDSSSILEMLPLHYNSAPDTAYVGKEKIRIKKLDSIFDSIYKPDDHIFMKIDAQGFEKKILDGGEKSLTKILGIQIEMSLVPLYKEAPLYLELIDYLSINNYTLYSLENGFSDPINGQLFQVDGIFFKNKP